jgi:SAM-dependent methyltransferase
MDLDPELLKIAENWMAPLDLGNYEIIRGNARLAEEYPKESFDFVVSAGLGEFLKADEIEVLLPQCPQRSRPGGVLYASVMRYEKRSESFLKTFELFTRFRTVDQLGTLLNKVPWRNLKLVQDETGLQTYVHAVK